MTLLSSETIHATCIAIGGRAVLLAGRSGVGKSDLALRLIDRGATLVSDDYTLIKRNGSGLIAEAPPSIGNRMEVRGIGIVDMPGSGPARVALLVDLDAEGERMPAPDDTRMLLGVSLPLLALNAMASSSPLKVELALRLRGLP